MSDPVPGSKSATLVGQSAILALEEKGVPAERQATKLRSVWWYLPALLLLGVAFVPLYQGMNLVLGTEHIDKARLVALAVITLVPLAAALYCNSKADHEGTNAWLESIVTFGKRAREAAGR